MPLRVPTTQLYSFSAPVVKGADLIVPVLIGSGQPHGLRATIEQWRAAAFAIVSATHPAALHRARIAGAKTPDERYAADDAARPLVTKPGGQLL